MTRHRITHRTTYRYATPVALQPHQLLLVPRGDHELRVLAAALACDPPATFDWAQDVFGNMVATAIFAAATDRLAITAELLVEQRAPEWPTFRIAPAAHTYPFSYSAEERTDLGVLLAPHHADPGGRLAERARSFAPGPSTDTLSLLQAVSAGCGRSIAYQMRDEQGTQAPHETLASGSGSCRDIAALFIDLVRRLGFGARAVSGHLIDPGPNSGGSTHAWAEVYLPLAGWVAFDPTHGRLGSFNLVPVAVGRCNEQIMPVAGGYVGALSDFQAMEVQVLVSDVTAEDYAITPAPDLNR